MLKHTFMMGCLLVQTLTVLTPSVAADLDISIVSHIQPAARQSLIQMTTGEQGAQQGKSLLGNDVWQILPEPNSTTLALQIEPVSLTKRGVYGVSFHIQNVIKQYLLPVGMGVALPANNTDVVLYSPSQWMASFLVAELNDGSVISIWAKEAGYPYKKLTMNGGDFTIEMFRDAKSSVASNWVVRSYPNWQAATAAFRAEVLNNKHAVSGARARDINEVINLQLGQDGKAVNAAITKLASTHDAKRALLYMPLWRLNDYDENYPDYTPKSYVKEAIALAHRLGFRVMLHFNSDFVSPTAAEKNRFWEQRFLRWSSLGCKDGINYHLDKHPGRDSFRVNRGSQDWQSFLISSVAKSRQALGFDGVHLDVSSSIPVGCDSRMLTGTESLLSRLRQRMPDVLIGGEYITESSYTETDLYQALPMEIAGWPESLVNKSSFHPIGLSTFYPARAYGHLRGGAVDPDGKIVAAQRAHVAADFAGNLELLMIPTIWASPNNLK